jgi:predicted transposase YdaD
LKEAIEMSRSKVTLEQVLEETGLIAEWVARGRAAGEAIGEARGKAVGKTEGKLEVAGNLIKIGLSPEKVAWAVELDIETVRSFLQH